MSDQSQGPGWWQASNGLWYPPDRKPREALPPAPDGERRWDTRPIQPGEGHWAVNLVAWIVVLLVAGAILRAAFG